LAQLVSDLDYNEAHFASVAAGVEMRVSHVQVALEILAGEHGEAGASERLTTLYLASRGDTPAPADATLQDLIATGSLRFITDDGLRNQIVAYHREVDRWAVRNFELINDNRVPYRNAVRSTISLPLQEAIADACDYENAPLSCAPEVAGDEARLALRSLESDVQLRSLLTLWGSSLRTARSSIARLMEPTRELRASIRGELEGR